MKTHRLKTWPKYFQKVLSGEKRFEIRKNDRDFCVGDIIVLQEWTPIPGEYTGGERTFLVTYFLEGGQFGIQDGYCVMSINPLTADAST